MDTLVLFFIYEMKIIQILWNITIVFAEIVLILCFFKLIKDFSNNFSTPIAQVYTWCICK